LVGALESRDRGVNSRNQLEALESLYGAERCPLKLDLRLDALA
jgi:hypothetical protein